ncbi:MAG TPA: biotin--[acetyl-CoA-carboxylase] ligase [Chitinophagaceae bacterium]|nr:biotin--[acetyl-CoA-carboxylase] ligase [Chitinophagaceae bacterium]
MATEPSISPFIELQSVDSTNNYARQLIHDKMAQHGTAIFSHEQIAGKGQRGKKWLTENKGNIAVSIIVKPGPIPLSAQFQLSACAAISAQTFFANYAGDDTSVKWPNDLYWQDRKAGGILIESIIRSKEPESNNRETGGSSWEWAIVGLGININQTSFPADIPNPVSLKQITGKTFEPVELAKELVQLFLKNFDELNSTGFESTYSAYTNALYKKGKVVKLRKENRVFEATIQTVTPGGRLVVEHGISEELEFGTVEWIIG